MLVVGTKSEEGKQSTGAEVECLSTFSQSERYVRHTARKEDHKRKNLQSDVEFVRSWIFQLLLVIAITFVAFTILDERNSFCFSDVSKAKALNLKS